MSAGEQAAGLGLLRGTVSVKPHSPEWDAAGRQTAAQLKTLLGDAAADIQHIGSTAVRSICAKPIIDLAEKVLPEDFFMAPSVLGHNITMVIAVFIVMMWNFFANRLWTYNDVKS